LVIVHHSKGGKSVGGATRQAGLLRILM
jgi:hypothetical protein